MAEFRASYVIHARVSTSACIDIAACAITTGQPFRNVTRIIQATCRAPLRGKQPSDRRLANLSPEAETR